MRSMCVRVAGSLARVPNKLFFQSSRKSISLEKREITDFLSLASRSVCIPKMRNARAFLYLGKVHRHATSSIRRT